MPSLLHLKSLPSHCALDYETALTSGEPSIHFYREDFRATCAAFTWSEADALVSEFVQGEEAIAARLQALHSAGTTLIVHNLSFEYGVTRHRFGLDFEWIDTMRLVQNLDNGGKEDYTPPLLVGDAAVPSFDDEDGEGEDDLSDILAPPKTKTGVSLTASVSRILPSLYHNHKDEAYSFIRDCGVKAGKEGANLHLLPLDILARYNIGDSENTWRLYTECTDQFAAMDYDWTPDHQLYTSIVKQVVSAEARGIAVNREALAAHIEVVQAEVNAVEATFRTQFAEQMRAVSAAKEAEEVAKLKTERGQAKRLAKYALEPIPYNIGSNLQLAKLFVGQLGMTPTFFTAKGAPSFKSAFLSQWGEGGGVLLKRRKRIMVLNHCLALHQLSERDGRWHPQLKASGTKTGRMSSGAQGD